MNVSVGIVAERTQTYKKYLYIHSAWIILNALFSKSPECNIDRVYRYHRVRYIPDIQPSTIRQPTPSWGKPYRLSTHWWLVHWVMVRVTIER
jgi:hypothetical protein